MDFDAGANDPVRKLVQLTDVHPQWQCKRQTGRNLHKKLEQSSEK